MSKRPAPSAGAQSLQDLLEGVDLAHLPPVAVDDILQGLPAEILTAIVDPALALQLVQEPVAKTLAVVARSEILRYFRRTVAEGIAAIGAWGGETGAFMPAFVAPLAAVCRAHAREHFFGDVDHMPVHERRIPLAWFLRNAPDAAGVAMDESDWDALEAAIVPGHAEMRTYLQFIRMRPVTTFVDFLVRAAAMSHEGPLNTSFEAAVDGTAPYDDEGRQRCRGGRKFWRALARRWTHKSESEAVYWLTYFRATTTEHFVIYDDVLIVPETTWRVHYLDQALVLACLYLWMPRDLVTAPHRVHFPNVTQFLQTKHWATPVAFAERELPRWESTRSVVLRKLPADPSPLRTWLETAPPTPLEARVARSGDPSPLQVGLAYYYDWLWDHIVVHQEYEEAKRIAELSDTSFDWIALFRRGLAATNRFTNVLDQRAYFCGGVLKALAVRNPLSGAWLDALYRVMDLLTDTDILYIKEGIPQDEFLMGQTAWAARANALVRDLPDFAERDQRLRPIMFGEGDESSESSFSSQIWSSMSSQDSDSDADE